MTLRERLAQAVREEWESWSEESKTAYRYADEMVRTRPMEVR